MASLLLQVSVVLLALWPVESLGAGPPCASDSVRPIAVCAEFVNPYSYNPVQWLADCGESGIPFDDVFIAYNAVDNLNASEPGCGYPGYYTATCCASFGGPCNLGIDCDIQTARPVPSGSNLVLPPDWDVYYDCVIDDPPGSILTGSVVYYGTALPYYCAALCESNGYGYAGVEMGDQCWCGTGIASENVQTAPLASQCNLPCVDGFTLACGGIQRMQVYWNA